MSIGQIAVKANETKAWGANIQDIKKALAESYLAEGLDDAALSSLAALGSRRRYVAGDVIVRQDEIESHLLILAKGRAEVVAFAEEPLYYLRPGMPFGEVALIDEKPRSATVRACEPSEVVLLPADKLRRLMQAQPEVGLVILRNLARVLCARVRSGNQQIAALETIEELRETQI